MPNQSMSRYFIERMRDKPINKLCALFDVAGVKFETLSTDAALANLPENLGRLLTNFGTSVYNLLIGEDVVKREQAAAVLVEFIQVLGMMSSECASKIAECNLTAVTAAQILQDQVMRQRVQAFLMQVAKLEEMDHLHITLLARVRDVLQRAQAEQENYLHGLKESVDPQLKAAAQEMNKLATSAVESANSNAMFDPPRRLGQLLAVLYFVQYVLPFEKVHYPDLEPIQQGAPSARPAPAGAEHAADPFQELLRKRFGGVDGQVYPTTFKA